MSADPKSQASKLILLTVCPLIFAIAVAAWLLTEQKPLTPPLMAAILVLLLLAVWSAFSGARALKRHQAQASLQRQADLAADRSLAVLEVAADGVISAGADKIITGFNPGAEKLFGFTAREAVGQPLDRLFAEAWRVPANSFFEMLLRKTTSHARMKIGETLALHKSGLEFPLYATLSMSRAGDEPVLFLVTRDISARKKVEQKLSKSAESQKVLNQLLRLSLAEGGMDDLLMRALTAIFSFPWLSSQAKGGIFLGPGEDSGGLIPAAQLGMKQAELDHFAIHGADEATPQSNGDPQAEQNSQVCTMVSEVFAITFCTTGSQSYYLMPIVSGGRLLGLTVLYVLEGQHNFEDEMGFLEAVSHTLAGLIEKRLAADALKASEANLRAKQARLDEDLRAAADIQRTLLPQNLPALGQLQLAWKFVPNQHIGGDIFNAFMLDKRHLALYMVDVSGHGVPSGLVTVSVHEMLAPQSGHVARAGEGGQIIPTPPRQVLDLLCQEYPVERFNKTFSIVYGVMDIESGEFTYASAGHPQPMLLKADGGMIPLEPTGPIIGLGALLPFEQARVRLAPGDKLVLYTDGVVEYENGQGEFYGPERYQSLLERHRHDDLDVILDATWQSLMEYGDNIPPNDDVSMLALRFHGDQ